METINVAVTFNLVDPYKDELIKVCGDRCNLLFFNSVNELKPVIGDIEVILGHAPADAEMFARAKNLKWMQSQSAGVEDLIDIFKAHGSAVLTNASGAYGLGISEYLIAYTFVIQKKLREYADGQAKREWRSHGRAETIHGADVTVVGLGNLGGTFAKKMSLLGARVRGVKHFPADKPDYLDALYTVDRLDEALAGADIVALCLPDTPKTRGLMSRERIFAMKRDAILLNAGRGSAIDQAALFEALNKKRIYAGLDVTVPEPLPADDPLWGCENLYLTPHVSGGPSSVSGPIFISGLMARNMKAYLDGGRLENVVDLDLGY
jgi:phosphoglycerate dehydrogenase-like enzyme